MVQNPGGREDGRGPKTSLLARMGKTLLMARNENLRNSRKVMEMSRHNERDAIEVAGRKL